MADPHLPSGTNYGATYALNKEFDASDNRGLALKVFSGTVLEAFRAKTVFYDNTGQIMVQKTLSGGHIAQWPVIGDDIDLTGIGTFSDLSSPPDGDFLDAGEAVAEGGLLMGYHTPGDFISGRKVKMSEATVRVDDILVAAIDVPFSDLDLSHFDVIRPFATKLGRSLAIDNDKKIATIAMKAAQNAGVTGVYPGGQQVTRTGNASVAATYVDSDTGSGLFRDDVSELAEAFDNDHVPEDGRYLFISPYILRIMRHEQDVFNRDYNPESLAGNLNERVLGTLEGFKLVLTTHLPTSQTETKFESTDSNLAKYDYDCRGLGAGSKNVAALALCGASEGSAAVGMVQAAGIRTVIQDDERRNVKFMKAQMMVGYDVVAPWCAGAIQCHA